MARRPFGTRVSMSPAYQAQARVPRRPRHTFNLVTRPFQIQPFLLAPVLPGETMQNALMQSRVVTDPLSSPLVGWWCEYYLFYVKHRDLDERDQLTNMMIDPGADISALLSPSTNPQTGEIAGGVPWMNMCLKRVVEEFFRSEGEAWDDHMIGGLPVSSVNTETFMNSVMNATDFTQPDVNVDADADGTVTASEVDAALRNWQMLRANNMTDMSYEDYLATYGVRTARQEVHVPELLRYVRDWGYPTNTVDPATGTPSTAQSWSIQDRADKNRYFSEPGFIFGVSTVRPKIYFGNIDGPAANSMKDALSWLPAIMHDDVYTSLKHFPQGEGPLTVGTDVNGYWIDMRDLLVYGDQFLNFDPSAATDANVVALPTAALQRRYAASADADALFREATANKVRHDGVVSFNISGRQTDTTPGVPA